MLADYVNIISMLFHRRFANVYIGWGHKYNAYNYSPPNMPSIQDQYKIGPEIMEMNDPTVEEEEAYRRKILPPVLDMSDYFRNESRTKSIFLLYFSYKFLIIGGEEEYVEEEEEEEEETEEEDY